MIFARSLKTIKALKRAFIPSGRQDSNLRSPAPKAGALTGLRYAPNFKGCKDINFDECITLPSKNIFV
jgi:hypothetical protein